VLPLGILALAIVAVPAMMFSPTGFHRLTTLREESARADAEIAKLSREIDELRIRVQRIKSDPATVEQVARDELGLVRQTELVFQFDR
jgi:cell division protein FtsB